MNNVYQPNVGVEGCENYEIPEEDSFVCPQMPRQTNSSGQKMKCSIDMRPKEFDVDISDVVKVRGLESFLAGTLEDQFKEFRGLAESFSSHSSVKERLNAIENDPAAYSRLVASGSIKLTSEFAFAGFRGSVDSGLTHTTQAIACENQQTSGRNRTLICSNSPGPSLSTGLEFGHAQPSFNDTPPGPPTTATITPPLSHTNAVAHHSPPSPRHIEGPGSSPSASLGRCCSTDSDISAASQDPCPSSPSSSLSSLPLPAPTKFCLVPTDHGTDADSSPGARPSVPVRLPAPASMEALSVALGPAARRVASGERLEVVRLDSEGGDVLRSVTFHYADGTAATFPSRGGPSSRSALPDIVGPECGGGGGNSLLLHVGEHVTTVRYRHRRAALTHQVVHSSLELVTSLGRTVTLGRPSGVGRGGGGGTAAWTAANEYRAAAGSCVVGLRLAGDSDGDSDGEDEVLSPDLRAALPKHV